MCGFWSRSHGDVYRLLNAIGPLQWFMPIEFRLSSAVVLEAILLLILLWFEFLALSIFFFFLSVLLMAHRYFRKTHTAMRPAVRKMAATETMIGTNEASGCGSPAVPGLVRTGVVSAEVVAGVDTGVAELVVDNGVSLVMVLFVVASTGVSVPDTTGLSG